MPARYRIETRLLALALSALLGALALEAFVRLHCALTGDAPPHADRSVHAEWRWARAHLARGGALVDGAFAFHPKLGWTRGDLATESAAGPAAAQPGLHRLVLVGDSYTASYGVGERDAMDRVLGSAYLPGWEVINLAVQGYGPDQATLMYELEGERHRPDVAALGFFVHGHFRSNERFRSYAKPYFSLDEGGALALHDENLLPPDALLEAYRTGARRIGGWSQSYAWAALRGELRVPFALRRIDAQDREWQLTAAVLRRFFASARTSGAKPLLVIIPASPGRHEGRIYEQIDHLAREEARREGVPFVALADTFLAVPDDTRDQPLYASDDLGGHFTAAGYREMARQIAQAVLRLHPPTEQASAAIP